MSVEPPPNGLVAWQLGLTISVHLAPGGMSHLAHLVEGSAGTESDVRLIVYKLFRVLSTDVCATCSHIKSTDYRCLLIFYPVDKAVNKLPEVLHDTR